jgi:hypothetical protein
MVQSNPGSPSENVPDDVSSGDVRNGTANSVPVVSRAVHADEEMFDWDCKIDAPARPLERWSMRFVEGGRRPIKIPDDPQD